jgi:hypothetical protein
MHDSLAILALLEEIRFPERHGRDAERVRDAAESPRRFGAAVLQHLDDQSETFALRASPVIVRPAISRCAFVLSARDPCAMPSHKVLGEPSSDDPPAAPAVIRLRR